MNDHLSVNDLLENISKLETVEFEAFIKGVQSLRPKKAATEDSNMDEGRFWAIIALLDWEKETGPEIVRPAIEALSQFSRPGICAFQDILNEKLYALDGKRFAEQLGSNAFGHDRQKHFSVDDFLFARCGVVANGQPFFDEVLKNPEMMPKEFTFEPLLYLPDRAWQLKTGLASLDHFPEKSFDTFSNLPGRPGIKPLGDRF